MVDNIKRFINRGEYAPYKRFAAYLFIFYFFYKFIWPILKGVFNFADDKVTDIQAIMAGLSKAEIQKYKTDARSVALALGTNEDRDIWWDMSWFTEDEKAAYDVLKNYIGKFDVFDIFYRDVTGGNSIITDVHKYFTGSDAKYKSALGL